MNRGRRSEKEMYHLSIRSELEVMQKELNKKESQREKELRKQKATVDDVANEANDVAELFVINNETRWNIFDSTYYLISRKWFDRWKKYVNYDKSLLKQTSKSIHKQKKSFDTTTILMQDHPGPISNDALLIDQRDIFVDEKYPNAQINYILKDNMREERDYYVFPANIWDYLFGIYGGIAIPRYSVPTGNGRQSIEIKLNKVNILYILIIYNIVVGQISVHKEWADNVRIPQISALSQQFNISRVKEFTY